MIPFRRSPSFRTAPILCAAAVAALTIGHSQAASLTWDSSGTSPTAPIDGAGTWSTSNVNWAGGGIDSAWNNAANNDAVFGAGGTGGTVTVSTNVTANSLVVSRTGYTIQSSGGSVITLTSGSINNLATVTINSIITGANGLTKSNGGTLGLGGVNTYTGTTYILQGSLQPRVVNALPTATVVAIGTPGNTTSATFDVRSNSTVAGIVAVGSTPSANTISNTQTTSTTLTINPDGAGGAAADSTFAGVITQGAGRTLSLTKAGSHTLTLTGSNTYTGTTTVTGGSLIVNGYLSTSSTVTVQSAGRFGGTGTIGTILISGTLGGGNGGIGTLNTGDVTINSGGALENEFGRSGVTPTSDRINVTGAVSLISGANLQLTLSGLTPVSGDIFYLVSNDSTDAVSGVFTKLNGVTTTLNEGSIFSFNSQSYQITYTADFDSSSFSGGNDIAIQVVPEPRVCALFGLGAGAVLLLRRRRNF